MSVLQAVFLGILQGFAEFIPVSSSGHLVLFQKIFGITESALTFDIVVHLGSLIPVFIVFWKEIAGLIKKPFQKTMYLLVVATIPAVVAVVFLGDFIDSLFETGQLLGFCFLITGVVLLFADRVSDGKKEEKDITYLDAVVIGCMQAVATVPGISRSGSTISGALVRKLNRETAARFSFLMSIPVILGAALLEVIKVLKGGASVQSGDMLPLLFGFVASALAGYLSIKFMLKLIKECKLKYFSCYVFVLAALIFADQLVFKMFF